MFATIVMGYRRPAQECDKWEWKLSNLLQRVFIYCWKALESIISLTLLLQYLLNNTISSTKVTASVCCWNQKWFLQIKGRMLFKVIFTLWITLFRWLFFLPHSNDCLIWRRRCCDATNEDKYLWFLMLLWSRVLHLMKCPRISHSFSVQKEYIKLLTAYSLSATCNQFFLNWIVMWDA